MSGGCGLVERHKEKMKVNCETVHNSYLNINPCNGGNRVNTQNSDVKGRIRWKKMFKKYLKWVSTYRVALVRSRNSLWLSSYLKNKVRRILACGWSIYL